MIKSTAAFTALIAGAVLACAAPASPAAAQSFTPAPSGTTFSGAVLLSPAGLTCKVNMTLAIDSAGAAVVTSRSLTPPASPFCGLSQIAHGTWTIAPATGSTTSVTMTIGYIYGPAHGAGCHGTVTVPFAASGTSATITFSNTPIPPIPGGVTPCRLTGVLASTAPLAITP